MKTHEPRPGIDVVSWVNEVGDEHVEWRKDFAVPVGVYFNKYFFEYTWYARSSGLSIHGRAGFSCASAMLWLERES